MTAVTTTETPEPASRFEHFLIRYPSGTVIESYYLTGGGGTLRQAQVEHPMATVEPVSDSRVIVEADRT